MKVVQNSNNADVVVNSEAELNSGLNKFTVILSLQTLIIFLIWYFGVGQVNVVLYDVNYNVFDLFFSLCVRVFICISTYYFILRNAINSNYRKHLVAINYWLACTYLILCISKLVLLIGGSYYRSVTTWRMPDF